MILGERGERVVEMDHTLQAEAGRIAEAAVKQGVWEMKPGETKTIDLSDKSIYIHIPVGVNVLQIVVQRPE